MAAYLLVSTHADHTQHSMVLRDDDAAFRVVAGGATDDVGRKLATWMQTAQTGAVFAVRSDPYARTNMELVRLGSVTYADKP